MQKIFTVVLAIFALVGLHSNTFADENTPASLHIVSRPGQPHLVSLRSQEHRPFVARDTSADAGLIDIANTITQYPNSPYWGWYGYVSYGPQANGAAGTLQWLASAFTPTANHVATRVEVAAEYYSGTNDMLLSLYDDAGGVPGKSLHTWHLTNLPNVVCCAVVGGSYAHGVSLSAGKQYWVVLSTSAKDSTAAAIWVLTEFANVQKLGSDFDVYCSGPSCAEVGYKNNAWNTFPSTLYGLAYSVLGK